MLSAGITQQQADRSLLWLKRWIWIYFWLLIFEGALRKWIIPPLSGPLLIIRDPVALIIYCQAYRCRRFSMSTMWPFAILMMALSLLAMAQIIAGINTVPIAVYGLRSYVLHLPLVLVVANTLSGEDVRKVGRWLLMLAVPMTLLFAMQYYASSGGWINAGAGEGAKQIGVAEGHIRPAGTFSYGLGASCYLMLVAAYVLYGLTRPRMYSKLLLWPAVLTTVLSVPLLGSRTVAFQMAALIGFALLSGISKFSRVAGLAKIVCILILATIVAMQLPVFDDAIHTYTMRWQDSTRKTDAGEQINSRVFGSFEKGVESAGSTEWLGAGIGMGSNFAAYLQTGSMGFLVAEDEWERVVVEFGPGFGLAFMGMRAVAVLCLVLLALRAMKRNDDILAWLLVPAVAELVLMAVMEQPTNLGFMVFGAGLLLAAAQTRRLPMTYRVAVHRLPKQRLDTQLESR